MSHDERHLPVWLATIPNEGRSADATSRGVHESTGSLCGMHKIEMPGLKVGTLDTLMALSDDIEKVDMAIEVVVKKVERQYGEVIGAKLATFPLLIGDVPPLRYLQQFEWDHAKYPFSRNLPELVALIQSGVSSIEDELKHLSVQYAEKMQAQQALKRKKGAKLSSTPLDEVLTVDMVKGVQFHDTEYLVTLVATVPKEHEETWVKTYSTLGADIVDYGNGTHGSPAVPKSSVKLYEEGDSALWTVTVLKGQFQAGFVDDDKKFQNGTFIDFVEGYKAACKERKVVVREYAFNPERAVKSQKEAAELGVEVQQLQTGLIRWCGMQFGEAFVAWMHVKVVRAFVESVLRYGLPVDFITVLLLPAKNCEAKLQATLTRMLAHLQGAGLLAAADDDDEDDGAEKYSPTVLQKFAITP